MQIVKTLGWVLLTAFVVSFVWINYGEKHDVVIWPTTNDALVFNWPVGVIALMFWLLGVLPMMVYHRSVKCSLERRIRSLENSIKSSALAAQRRQEASVEASSEPTSDAVPRTDDVLGTATSLSEKDAQ